MTARSDWVEDIAVAALWWKMGFVLEYQYTTNTGTTVHRFVPNGSLGPHQFVWSDKVARWRIVYD